MHNIFLLFLKRQLFSDKIFRHKQGRRAPPAQLLRISGFVNSKTDGKMLQFCTNFDVFSKKKRYSFFHMLISQCHFDGPSEPLLGPLKPTGPMMGRGVIVPPAPPLVALDISTSSQVEMFTINIKSHVWNIDINTVVASFLILIYSELRSLKELLVMDVKIELIIHSNHILLGIGNAASIFGPVIGYALGGVVLGIYVDVDVVDVSK